MREEVFHAVAQALGHVTRIVPERLRGVAGLPAADTVLQRLRQIPVIQRRVGFDAVLQELIDQPVVEIEPLGIRRTAAFRKHPRPGDRKPVGLDAEIPDQADVFLVAMVMIVGAVGVAAILDLARRMRESVPDRTAAAVLIDGAFDLIGRRGGAPDKILRKRRGRVPLGCRPGVAIRRLRAASPCRARKAPRAWQNAGAKISKTSATPSPSGIDLPGRNPVDLEGDRNRGGRVHETDTGSVFVPIARLTIIYTGSTNVSGTSMSNTGLRSMK